MRIRQPDDDPTLFAPNPPWSVWRGWAAFVSFLPIVGTFVVGLPTVAAVGILWAIGGWEYVASVWSEPAPYALRVLPTMGLIIVGSIGGGLALMIWHAIFFSSGFIDQPTFKGYFDLTKPKRLAQAAFAWAVVGGALVWLLVLLLPA